MLREIVGETKTADDTSAGERKKEKKVTVVTRTIKCALLGRQCL